MKRCIPIDDVHFDVCGQDGKVSVRIKGEIDIAVAPRLRASLDEAIERASSVVMVDFSDVTLLDSTGLGVLIGAAKRIRANGGELAIRNVASNVMKTFTFTGTDTLLDVKQVEPI